MMHFCLCNPSASTCDVLCARRCFSARHGWKEWLFELVVPFCELALVQSGHLLWPRINCWPAALWVFSVSHTTLRKIYRILSRFLFWLNDKEVICHFNSNIKRTDAYMQMDAYLMRHGLICINKSPFLKKGNISNEMFLLSCVVSYFEIQYISDVRSYTVTCSTLDTCHLVRVRRTVKTVQTEILAAESLFFPHHDKAPWHHKPRHW